VVETLTHPDLEGPRAANMVVLGAMALVFVWRRSRPLLTLSLLYAGATVMAAFLTPPPEFIAAVLMLIVANYSTGAHLEGRRGLLGLAVGVGGITGLALAFDPGDIFFPVVVLCFVPWLAGRTMRHQTLLARELAEKAERAEHARADEERRAIAMERSRIARELHDVLAHDLSVMVVQAGAARRVVERDADAAVASAQLIERTGREALVELRHLFGTVRRDDGEPLGGLPGVGRVDRLAQRARDAGLPVELRVEGEPRQLPTGVDLTAFRVVQEALTNALKHAGSARAKVTVRYEPRELLVEVEDDGVGAAGADRELSELGGGHGLVGMRERVELYGGLMQAGRRRGGGFVVRAQLPTAAEPVQQVPA